MDDRKPRIDDDSKGMSPLARLKKLVKETPEEAEFLQAQSEELSSRRLIAQIESRHGIYGLTEQRLSDFWRWLAERKALEEMNQDAETWREAFCTEINPSATLAEAHEKTLAWLHVRAAREDSEKLMKFVLTELRKARESTREDKKVKMLEAKIEQAQSALQKLREPNTADSEESRQAILDEVDRIMGIKKN